jgi:hypothetical protein
MTDQQLIDQATELHRHILDLAHVAWRDYNEHTGTSRKFDRLLKLADRASRRVARRMGLPPRPAPEKVKMLVVVPERSEAYHLLTVVGGVQAEVDGPYPTAAACDAAARQYRKVSVYARDEENLFRLTVWSAREVEVDGYTNEQLDANEEPQ